MRFALSASGSRILLAHANGASLFETGSGRRVATATLPPGWRPMSIRFVDESTARVWLIPALGQQVGLADDAALRILEIAVGREPRTIEAALVTPVESGRAWPGIARPDAAGRRFLTLDGGVRLRDAGTGALLATLLERPVSAVAFTADDRIVVGEAVGERTILRFYSSEGEPRGDLTLDRVGAGLGIGPPVAPGRVAVHFSSFRSGGETVVVDVSARQVVETLPGLRPLHGYWMVEARPPTPGGDVPTVHFLRREDDAIVRRDFATGEQQVVVGPGAPAGERLEFH
jgi:hypothetical protein